MRFSERAGFRPIKKTIQVDEIDNDLRIGLWNVLSEHCWSRVIANLFGTIHQTDPDMSRLCRLLWTDYFKRPLDTLPDQWPQIYELLRKYYFGCPWYEVYDFVEFVVSNCPPTVTDQSGTLPANCNRVLEQELSGYRFIGDKLARIISDVEISSVEEAIASSDLLRPVALHMKSALALLADRKSPDYRNSIKESISAVEAACKLIANDDKGTLGSAIKRLKLGLHPSLETAFSKLYAYTSDANGIRHALMEEPDVSFEDAKLMLVSCSAFVGYLAAKMAKSCNGQQ